MDNLTEALSAGPRIRQKCRFKDWLGQLSEEDQLSVKKAMLDPAWTTTNLFETFKKFDLPVGRDSLGRHRDGKCALCGPV